MRHHCLHPENCVAGKRGRCRLCTLPEKTAWHAEAQSLRDAGMTLQEVGDRFGVCKERVRQVTKPIPAEVQAEIYRQQHEAYRLVSLDRIRECAAAGMSKVEAARKLGYRNPTPLWLTAKRHGIRFRDARHDPRPIHNRDLAIELFAAGKSAAEIAPLTGYKNGASVTTALHRLGITCHSRGDFKHREAAE